LAHWRLVPRSGCRDIACAVKSSHLVQEDLALPGRTALGSPCLEGPIFEVDIDYHLVVEERIFDFDNHYYESEDALTRYQDRALGNRGVR
jgi:hypothetical protein